MSLAQLTQITDPKITIITVVLNETRIESTIQSIISQDYKNKEYIIIDGGSDDGTVEIIKKYEKFIDFWVSEKDSGIYCAMNKGVNKAIGDFIIHINAGDELCAGILSKIFLYERFSRNVGLIMGAVKYDTGRFVKSRYDGLRFKNSIHHQSVFYSRLCLKKLGLYDVRYHILADYDLNCRFFLNEVAFKQVDFQVAFCRAGGVSDSPKFINYIEEYKIREANFGGAFIILVLRFYSISRFMLKKLKTTLKVRAHLHHC